MKLSIITINFNNKVGLEKTIESVLSQTWRDFEWIIIDGGSTDGSREVIEELVKNPVANISYWCSETDSGVYNAMNKGILKASGDYLNFMNSGDCYASSTILKDIFTIDQNCDVFYGYMVRKNIDGELHNKRSMKDNICWNDFYFDTLPHQSSFIRRNLFDKVGLYDESYKMLADWKWFAEAASVFRCNIVFIPKVISIYECGGISETGDWKLERNRMRKEVYGKCLTLHDLEKIHELNTIYNHNWSLFLYRVLKKLTKLIYRKESLFIYSD